MLGAGLVPCGERSTPLRKKRGEDLLNKDAKKGGDSTAVKERKKELLKKPLLTEG